MSEISSAWHRYRLSLHALNVLRSQGKHCPVEALVLARARVTAASAGVCHAYIDSAEPMFEDFPDHQPPDRAAFERLEDSIDGSAAALLIIQRVGHGMY